MLLVHAFLDVLADGLGDVQLGQVFPAPTDQLAQPLRHVGGLQQPALLRVRQVSGVARQVGQGRGVGDALHRIDELESTALLQDGGCQRLVFLGQLGQLSILGDLREHGGLDPERGARPGGAGADPHPRDGPDHCRVLAAAQPADLLDHAERAKTGVLAVQPRHQQHLRLRVGVGAGQRLGRLDGGAGLGVGHRNRDDHPGQYHDVVQRQHRQRNSVSHVIPHESRNLSHYHSTSVVQDLFPPVARSRPCRPRSGGERSRYDNRARGAAPGRCR